MPGATPPTFVPNLVLLGFESQQVVGLRLARILAGGGDAYREMQLMAREKLQAGIEAVLHLAAGGSPVDVVDNYRRIVQANIARLTAEGCRRGSIASS